MTRTFRHISQMKDSVHNSSNCKAPFRHAAALVRSGKILKISTNYDGCHAEERLITWYQKSKSDYSVSKRKNRGGETQFEERTC